MNREDILKVVQEEKSEAGEYEKLIARKSIMYGAAFGVALCTIMVIAELFILKKMDYGKPTILFAISGYANLYEGIKNKRKKMIIIGVIDIVVTLFGLLLFVGELIA